MNLQSGQRYPLLKYLYEDFTYAFYKTEKALINRLLILYHNRNTLGVNDYTGDFVDECKSYLRGQKFKLALFFDKRKLCSTRDRVLFLLDNNPRIIDELLTRDDYTSPVAKRIAFSSITEWLASIKDTHNPLTSQWLIELRLQSNNSDAGSLKVQRPKKIPRFHNIFIGSSDAERQVKFEKLLLILIRSGWIIRSNNSELFDYKLPKTGGRLHLAALVHCLNRRGHFRNLPDGPRLAAMIKQWLFCEISLASLAKSFQSEEQKSFECGVRDKRYKYVEAALQIVKEFEMQQLF